MHLIPFSLMCQMEKTEAPPPRFRRKHHQHGSASSSSTSEGSTNSSHSSRRRTDAPYGGLLEEEPVSHIQIPKHTLASAAVNGSCDATQSSQAASSVGENDADTVDVLMIRPNRPAPAEDAAEAPRNGCSDLAVLQLPPELEGLPHSDILSLTSDGRLSISCCRVYREEALLLVLFVCNTTEKPLGDVAVELSCEELEVSCDIVTSQRSFLKYCTSW